MCDILSYPKYSLARNPTQGAIGIKCHLCDKERKMTQNSDDLRVRRTRKLIREALIALIEERSFDAITVGEIAKRAMVSRAAFYRYYHDKYDLVEQLFEEAMHTLMSEIGPASRHLPGNLDPQHLPEPWVKLFEHFAGYER